MCVCVSIWIYLCMCVCVCVCVWITGLKRGSTGAYFFGSDRPPGLLESLSSEWMVVLSGSDGSLSVLSLARSLVLR